MRRTRRGKKAGAKSWAGAALIAAALAALAALSLAGFLLRPAPVDPETLCRLDGPPAAHALILVDATDRLEARHKRLLRAVALQERARLSEGDRFTLMRINARRPHEPSILFSKCLPKPPERTNPLFENPRLAQERWDAAFEDGLEAALRSAQSARRQSASPIIAGLRAAAADPDFSRAIAARRLVLVSDLLEHDSEGFSLYDSGADYETWAARDPQGPPDLSGVEVRVTAFNRPDHIARQAETALPFWRRFFEEADARSASFDPAP